MSWSRVNKVGWLVETMLRWTVLLALLVVVLLIVLRFEWSLVSAETRNEILCGERFSAPGPGFPLPWNPSTSNERSEDLQQYLNECEHNPEGPVMPPLMTVPPQE